VGVLKHTDEKHTDDPSGTAALGAKLAETLAPGDVVLVRGPLGVGKTVFIRGAARQLGVQGAISSPSFVIGRRHVASVGSVSHLDLYRLKSMANEDPALLDDYLTADAVAFVEWPDVAAEELARLARSHQGRVVEVEMAFAGGDRRSLSIR